MCSGAKSHSPVFTLRNTEDNPLCSALSSILDINRVAAYLLAICQAPKGFFKLAVEHQGSTVAELDGELATTGI